MELTNAIRKLIKSLSESKYRRKERLFVVEGSKCVSDTAGAFVCVYLFGKKNWISLNKDLIARLAPKFIFEINGADMELISHLNTPSEVMAVYEIPQEKEMPHNIIEELVVALDRIQDPGNLGTIVRLCDWMGVTTILASKETVDIWAPKSVQSTMGAIARVNVIYCDLPSILSKWGRPVYGTFLNAPNIYTANLGANGIIVFGNEGRGISPEVAECVTQRLLIPSFPPDRPTSDSLNVATAAAITLSQFRSRQMKSRN